MGLFAINRLTLVNIQHSNRLEVLVRGASCLVILGWRMLATIQNGETRFTNDKVYRLWVIVFLAVINSLNGTSFRLIVYDLNEIQSFYFPFCKHLLSPLVVIITIIAILLFRI